MYHHPDISETPQLSVTTNELMLSATHLTIFINFITMAYHSRVGDHTEQLGYKYLNITQGGQQKI